MTIAQIILTSIACLIMVGMLIGLLTDRGTPNQNQNPPCSDDSEDNEGDGQS